MADAAPLINAHAHVQKAGQETALSHWTEAAGEHKHAADEFKRASRTTSDAEALRILSLLEGQHRKLAHIITVKNLELELVHDVPAERSGKQSATASPATSTKEAKKASPTAKTDVSTPGKRINASMRESSPSLAREMASRRGIPPARTQQKSPITARGEVVSEKRTAPRIPSSIMDSQARLPPKEKDDEGFTNFYSNLTTGTMSKLSSVLAFAGLPLASEEPKEESQASRLLKRTVKASTEPDVKKIFSKAALNAIEEEHKQKGLQGQAFGPAESFYVVQTAGGTRSYADIAKVHHLTGEPIGGDDEESFVDAREAQPPSPRHSRNVSMPHRRDFGSARTAEELELENTTLKQTLEQLASRLADFEVHAQDASMAALTQSVANLRQGPALADAGPQERIKLLEKRIEQQAEQREKLEELAKKQEKKIRAYHSKWEEIKKNAREKEKTKREQGVTPG